MSDDEGARKRAHLGDAGREHDVPHQDDHDEQDLEQREKSAHQPRIRVSLVTVAGTSRRTKTSSAFVGAGAVARHHVHQREPAIGKECTLR